MGHLGRLASDGHDMSSAPPLPFDPRSACAASRILLALDSSRAERWRNTEAYGRWFWGVLHFPSTMEDEAQCVVQGVACLTSEDLPQVCFDASEASEPGCFTCARNMSTRLNPATNMSTRLYWGFALHVFEPHEASELPLGNTSDARSSR